MSEPHEALRINFRAHELNTGSEAGARADFEQMIAQLVDARYPGARQVSANPGDGGIDVFVGRLDDRIIVWQTKYFLPRVTKAHRRQITESFDSAQRNAGTHGYQIGTWILCVPSSMDHPTTLWWDGWRRAQAETHTEIDIWDETALRRMLAEPAATAVLAAFYPPTRPRPWPPEISSLLVDPNTQVETDSTAPPRTADQPARAGETVRIAGRPCLLHGDPQEWRGDGWLLRTGAVSVLTGPSRPAWFRQVLIERPGPRADEHAAAIDAQVRLLDQFGGRGGLPRLVKGQVGPAEAAVLCARPAGRSWREVFGPVDALRGRPLRPVTAGLLLTVAAHAAAVLIRLHEAGHSHRALVPDGVVLTGDGTGAALRDLGLAAVPRQSGEGPAEYRAPEQERLGFEGAEVGARTDVFRLAAMTYHGLTGRLPALGQAVSLHAFGLPVLANLDEVLRAALDPDPDRRPSLPDELIPALQAGAADLARARH